MNLQTLEPANGLFPDSLRSRSYIIHHVYITAIMPDWFYCTISQRVLFALSPAAGRDLALGVMGGVSRLPGGKFLIDVLGHMLPDARLARTYGRLTFGTGVGIGLGLDMCVAAPKALARFGAGLLEVGPIALVDSAAEVIRDRSACTLMWRGRQRIAVKDVVARLPERSARSVVTLARIAPQPVADLGVVIRRLHGRVRAIALELDTYTAAEIADRLAIVQAAVPGLATFVVLAAAIPHDRLRELARVALAQGAAGVLIDAALQPDADAVAEVRVFSPALLETLRGAVAELRTALGPDACVLAAGSVYEPADALALRAAGASLILVDSGLVFSGPGLIKRINDAELHTLLATEALPTDTAQFEDDPQRVTLSQSWFWLMLLGLGMVFGGLLAAWIALDHVLLPYDEVFVGLTRARLHALNSRLLDFLTHDRITLAGLMLTAGTIYTGLAVNQVRAGWHWAEGTILASAIAGSLSFFLFLGYGYFEPFHGFVTAVLLQFVIAGMRSKLNAPQTVPLPALRETRDWRASLWGQLCWILFGVGLLGAGATISIVGISTVFVPPDLTFMSTSADTLRAASPRLLPLIAHDRATVGGMLISCGFAYLLPSLWGFRRGDRALWWTLVLAAIPAFSGAIGIHLHVGYLDLWHLAPIVPALALFCTGAALSWRFLCVDTPTAAAVGATTAI
jgi:dihydroorotate dehydrogenase